MKIAIKFKAAIEKYPTPLYLLAQKTGFHPARLSHIKNGQEIKRIHDIRFRLLADLIGFNGKLFDEGEKAA